MTVISFYLNVQLLHKERVFLMKYFVHAVIVCAYIVEAICTSVETGIRFAKLQNVGNGKRHAVQKIIISVNSIVTKFNVGLNAWITSDLPIWDELWVKCP